LIVSGSGEDKLSHRPFAGLEALKKVVEERAPAEPVEREPPKPEPPALPDEPHVDEDRLFRREMRGVAPLDGRDNFVSVERQASPPPEAREEAEVMAQLADLVDGKVGFDFNATDEYIDGIATGLDRRLLKRLRQGYFAVQGHLDLHGKTRQEARPLVEQFLQESRRAGRRCVLIVHGRGRGSKDQIPVLKESLRIWLARGRIARSVLAFCSARPADGGVGAVYVLLRK
jgi:DNA-nicking Smr family endonuclease